MFHKFSGGGFEGFGKEGLKSGIRIHPQQTKQGVNPELLKKALEITKKHGMGSEAELNAALKIPKKLLKRSSKLYSVLLTEDELRFFSEVQRMYAEEEKKKESHTLRNLAIGAAATAGTIWAGRRGYLGTGVQRNLGKAESWMGKKLGSQNLVNSGAKVQGNAAGNKFLKDNKITDVKNMTAEQNKAYRSTQASAIRDARNANAIPAKTQSAPAATNAAQKTTTPAPTAPAQPSNPNPGGQVKTNPHSAPKNLTPGGTKSTTGTDYSKVGTRPFSERRIYRIGRR